MKKVFEISTDIGRESIQPVLSIRVGEKHFSYAITDKVSGSVTKISYYTDEAISGNSLAVYFTQNPEWANSFFRVLVGYDYPDNMLVPAAGFSYEEAGVLKQPFTGTSVTITEQINEWQLYNVYAVPRDVHDLLSGKFPAMQYWHQVSVGLKNMHTATEAGHMQVDIRHQDLSVITTRSGRLLLAQTFGYNTPEDVIYYLLKICYQFALSQNEIQIDLSGLIDKESALYKELYQYFINISFREADWKINSQEYPSHFFTSLNDLSGCAS